MGALGGGGGGSSPRPLRDLLRPAPHRAGGASAAGARGCSRARLGPSGPGARAPPRTWSGITNDGGRSISRATPLAPVAQPAGDRAARVVEPAQLRQLLVGALGRALVPDSSTTRHSSRAHSSRPRSASSRSIARPERQQAARVVGGVGELLVGERALVPAREPLAAAQLHAEHAVHERLVALLVAEAQEAGGHLGVEDVGHVGLPGAAHDRHVLAAGVHDHLDLGVGERRGERRRVEAGRRRAGRAPRSARRPRRRRAPRPARGTAAPGSGARRRTRCRSRGARARAPAVRSWPPRSRPLSRSRAAHARAAGRPCRARVRRSSPRPRC